jgi:hypothetical protein
VDDNVSSLEIARELFGIGSSEPTNEFSAIARILIADRDAAWKRFFDDHSQPAQREMIRVTLAAIEGLLWQLKQHILRDPDKLANLSIHEQAALRDESYAVDERGNVRTQSRFHPTTSSIRLVVSLIQRFQPEYTMNFSDENWRHMQTSVGIRNRLAHPKQMCDLTVTNLDVLTCQAGFLWFSVFALFALELHKVSWSEIEAHLPKDQPMPAFFRLTKTGDTESPNAGQ